MRKIISKQEREKKQRIKQFIVGGILVFIMLISTLGYSFQGQLREDKQKIEYNGFEFIQQNEMWYTQIKGYEFGFKNNPEQTEDFESYSDVNLLAQYQNKPLYIYSENREAEAEIYRNLNEVVQRMQFACPEKNESAFETKCKVEWPIKNCSNNFILIKEGNFQITPRNNCVFIEGPKENLTKITDEFLFKTIGIKL